MLNQENNNTNLDILIIGGTLLTMSKEMEIIEAPIIGIKNGKILFAKGKKEGPIQYRAKEIIDAQGSVIMPGLVNTHTHLPMVCFRGLADDLPLMDWLNNYIFPAEAKYASAEMVYDGAILAIAEMFLSGTTTVSDGYFFEDSVAQAAIETGMRAVVCQGFVDFPTPDNPDPSKNADIAKSFIEKWTGVSSLITPALFCHAPYTCCPDTYIGIKKIARKGDVFLYTHLAETMDEIKTIQERYGRTPVHHLHHLGVLDDKTVAVHCNFIDDEEISILADCKTKVSHNPESSMKLASGVAPIPKMQEKGITVGLGTDGCASNNDLDMFKEMDTAAKLHKVTTMDPTVMNARTVLKMATIDGASALGLEDRIGSIEAGKCADIIILDMKKPHLTPLYNSYSHIVYAASGSDVSTTIVGGRIVMKDRRLLTIDAEKIMKKVKKLAGKIREGNII